MLVKITGIVLLIAGIVIALAGWVDPEVFEHYGAGALGMGIAGLAFIELSRPVNRRALPAAKLPKHRRREHVH